MRKSKLIKRCIAKDKKAWKIFLQRYSRLIYWSINKRLTFIGSEHQLNDIEDIFQEVFLTILEKGKLNQIKNKKSLSGWLAMVASHKTTDYMRRKFRNRENLIVNFPNFADYRFEENLLRRDTFSLIDKIIKQLPDKEKMVISFNMLEEKTHKEIAKITKMPINTVSTIISRTKEKIKNELKKLKENDV